MCLSVYIGWARVGEPIKGELRSRRYQEIDGDRELVISECMDGTGLAVEMGYSMKGDTVDSYHGKVLDHGVAHIPIHKRDAYFVFYTKDRGLIYFEEITKPRQ